MIYSKKLHAHVISHPFDFIGWHLFAQPMETSAVLDGEIKIYLIELERDENPANHRVAYVPETIIPSKIIRPKRYLGEM